MCTVYDEVEDILTIRLNDKPVVKKVSQDWNTHIGYAEDGSIVEVVFLEAKESGAWPLVNARLFNRILRMEARFDALSSRLERGFSGVPLDVGMREIEEAVVNERAEK